MFSVLLGLTGPKHSTNIMGRLFTLRIEHVIECAPCEDKGLPIKYDCFLTTLLVKRFNILESVRPCVIG